MELTCVMTVRIHQRATEPAERILAEVERATLSGEMGLQEALSMFGMAGTTFSPPMSLCACEFFVEYFQTLMQGVETNGQQVGLH